MDLTTPACNQAWTARYGEDLPPSGRPGGKTDHPRTERVAVLLTPEELDRVDARRVAQLSLVVDQDPILLLSDVPLYFLAGDVRITDLPTVRGAITPRGS